MQCSAEECYSVWCNIVQCSAVQCSAVQCSDLIIWSITFNRILSSYHCSFQHKSSFLAFAPHLYYSSSVSFSNPTPSLILLIVARFRPKCVPFFLLQFMILLPALFLAHYTISMPTYFVQAKTDIQFKHSILVLVFNLWVLNQDSGLKETGFVF